MTVFQHSRSCWVRPYQVRHLVKKLIRLGRHIPSNTETVSQYYMTPSSQHSFLTCLSAVQGDGRLARAIEVAVQVAPFLGWDRAFPVLG